MRRQDLGRFRPAGPDLRRGRRQRGPRPDVKTIGMLRVAATAAFGASVPNPVISTSGPGADATTSRGARHFVFLTASASMA